VHNLSISPANNSGAFNILDNMRKAYDWVFSHWAAAPLAPLAARWTRGASSPSSYSRTQNRFRLSGSPADPDEFDDSVIIHEFMHYVYDQIVTQIPPGGSHSGTARVPAGQAFSEGLSTALAQHVLDDPVYVDKTVSNTSVGKTNIETNANPVFQDHRPASMTGNVSEYLVAMLVWDLMDAANANEATDRIQEPSLTAKTFLFDLKPRVSRGAPSLDLVDFFDGWRCTSPQVASGTFPFDTDMRALAQERLFRYDFIPTPACP
jgi:hypothetical protein